ncbi:hypothetical protein GHT06_011048 [Daphnia sinensis]|uniref:Uncharacterized protein n=1 Tax=Daphnia sinensis TaxID=1820382 RepID=A0AAD5KZA9_9CRUS|nr:hypothetical protein GHT06_011048 [Daphnia sinensis]
MKGMWELIVQLLITTLVVDGQRTSTYTESRTISSTVDFSSNLICAKLVNVTGRCRQRRGFAMEQPILLMMDGPFHPPTDEYYHPLSQFMSTPTLRIEATPLIVPPDWPIDHSFQTSIEPSMPRTSARRKQQLGHLSKMGNAFLNRMASVNVTITNVFTHILSRTTATRTASFFLMGCTPSPFPYTICPASPETDIHQLLMGDDERKLFHKHPVPWPNKKKKKKKEPIVSTVTRTAIVTALTTSPTVALCAQLVNVTGPCRLHRGFRMEHPIVLSFDDDMDSIDSILTPTKTYSIEATAEPNVQGPESDHWVHGRGRRLFASSDPTIRSSVWRPEEPGEADRHLLGFHNLLGLKLALKKRIKSITIVTTVLVTVTSTSVDYITVSTKTFFVQICTPSPFPFDVCVRSRR